MHDSGCGERAAPFQLVLRERRASLPKQAPSYPESGPPQLPGGGIRKFKVMHLCPVRRGNSGIFRNMSRFSQLNRTG
ncbi:MAG: hypothetical protein DRH20_14485 [Deltaproteobacteria bacterium]|nr:MAG: hypothetical protein DRH20_14485 [Deltaproteobacteria bacterium]